MRRRKFIIGTRGSALALAQARHFAKELQKASPEILLEEKIIKTRGDLRLDVRLAGTGRLDKGLFTRELESALLQGEIDCAVHSLKDLPVEMPEGFALGAILPREDSADVLISKGSHPPGVVATSSPRRALQLAVEFPGVEIREIRGNVPTRIRKLKEDISLDGLVLALAGLKRLGFCDDAASWIQDEFKDLHLSVLNFMLPAPGQGAVAIQTRSDSTEFESLLQAVHCANTALCVSLERALLTALGGGCHLALGARARMTLEKKKPRVHLRGVYFPDETPVYRLQGEVASDLSDIHNADAIHALAAKLKHQWIKQ